MSRDSIRETDIKQNRPGATGHYRSDSRDWYGTGDEPPYSLPHRRKEQVQRAEGRTSRRKDKSPRSLGTSEVTMPPPSYLARAATESYRRPRDSHVYDYDQDSLGRRRRSRREPSPVYSPRGPAKYYSPYSSHSSASGAARGRDNDEHIEVIVEAGDGSSRHTERRRPSRDEYMDYPRRSYHRRQRRRHFSDDDLAGPRARSISPGRSPAMEVRRADNSASPRKSRHLQSADILDSRPPVASKKSARRGRKPSSEGYQEDAPRRSRSNRSRAASTSSRILEGIFGGSTRRPASEAAAPRSVECVICMGEVSPSRAAKLKCGHTMCNSCLVRSFKLSVNDPQQMPPRCCTKHHIPLKYVDRLFDDSFKKTWNRKFAEFSTKNRIYCPSKKCGEWIKPANISVEDGRKVARCGRCRTKVCGTCNGKWHHSEDCPKDEETLRFLAQAQEEGWKRCYKCKAIVELEAGCNHMTCRCGAEFCMICGIKWKGCNCPWFTYDDMDAPVRPPINNGIPRAMGDDRARLADNPFSRDRPPVVIARTPPRSYDEEMRLRRTQEQLDEEFARMLDESGDVDYGRDQSLFHDLGRRGLLAPGRPARVTPPPERAVDYVADVSRARGRQRGGSMERRLADRFSENRQSTRARANTGPGQPVPEMMPAPMPPSHGAAAPRQHTAKGDPYDDSPRRRRTERRSPRYHDDDSEAHGSTRSRRRDKREEAPRSSTLAGLNGVGRGMNRVFEWREFVEPGVPIGEGTPEVAQVHG